LDELYTYEEDHCDALNPFDSLDSDSVVRHAGEQGEVNPMCSLELRSRLEELQLQNETHQKRVEEKYQIYLARQQTQFNDLSHHVNKLSKLLHSLQDRSQALGSHSPHFSAQPSYRYHPYSQALTGPGIVCFFSRLISTFQLTKSNYSIQHLQVLVNIPLLMVALGTMHLRQLQLLHLIAIVIRPPAVSMPQSHCYQLHIHSPSHPQVPQMAARHGVNHSICTGEVKVIVSIPRKRPSIHSPN
jgi:hypothetical protein